MAFKLLVFAVLAASASAGFLSTLKLSSPEVFLFPPPDNTPQVGKARAAHDGFNRFMKDVKPPRYTFGYCVRDKNGTLFAQYERRDHNLTYGTYSSIYLDNSRLSVDYEADELTLFRVIATPATLTGHINPLEYAAIAGGNSGAITIVSPTKKAAAVSDPLADLAKRLHDAFVEFVKDLAVDVFSVGTDVEDGAGNVNSYFDTMVGDGARGSITETKVDGSRRTIDFSDDPRKGFQAVIRDPNTSVVSFIYG